MMKALVKLVLIGLGTVALTAMAVVFVRSLGLQQEFAAPPHPWLKRPFWWVYTPSTPDLCPGANQSWPLQGDWIVAIPVVRHHENWVVPCTQEVPLIDYLHNSSHQDWLLSLRAGDTWGLDELVASIGPLDKTIAIHSEAQKVSVYLRKKAPQWLYAADSAVRLRFHMFTSLWIETAMDFWPDFIITQVGANDPYKMSERAARELLRRQKRILWQWDESETSTPPFPIQGMVTASPSAAQQKFPQFR